jgi:hypothetical protein
VRISVSSAISTRSYHLFNRLAARSRLATARTPERLGKAVFEIVEMGEGSGGLVQGQAGSAVEEVA